MRRAAWSLLVLFVFAIPWEYSLDLGAPFGNVARILGLLTWLAAVPAVLQARRFRRFCGLHWLTLGLYLWFCCSFFWTVASAATLLHLRGYAQEMMLVWLVWELTDSPGDLRNLSRAWLAGSWVLAVLTMAGFALAARAGAEQVRFAAIGQDPNDVARYLDFGFPIAGLLLAVTKSRFERVFALAYFPAALAGVLLTASRSGVLLAMVALAGCCALAAAYYQTRGVGIAAVGLMAAAALVYMWAPLGTADRLGTISELWQHGNLNQRLNIWSEGWRAFEKMPVFGYGAGSFVTAAGMAPEDTAHNTVLAIVVEGGMIGLALAGAIVALSARAIARTCGPLRFGFGVLMIVWAISSVVGTVGENRMTWLLLGLVAVGQRLTEADPVGLALTFATGSDETLDAAADFA